NARCASAFEPARHHFDAVSGSIDSSPSMTLYSEPSGSRWMSHSADSSARCHGGGVFAALAGGGSVCSAASRRITDRERWNWKPVARSRKHWLSAAAIPAALDVATKQSANLTNWTKTIRRVLVSRIDVM